MKLRVHIKLLCIIASAAALSACGAKPEAVSEKPAQTKEMAPTDVAAREVSPPESKEESKSNAVSGGTGTEVVIEAHIKEIEGDTIIISSDSGEFPGAFLVDVSEHIENIGDYQSGDAVIIHMEDLGSKEQGMEKFLALRLTAAKESEQPTGKHDILLTAPPFLSLTDVLSSSMNQLELQAGNYEWNYDNKGQTESVIACGAAPLDAVSAGVAETLTIPRYREMKEVMYSVDTAVSPDKLVVTQWEAGNPTEPGGTIQYYCQPHMVSFEKDRVYEVTAIWNDSNMEINGFYGQASYVFVTQSQ